MTEWPAIIEFAVRDLPAAGERFDRLVETIAALWVRGTAA